MITIQERLKVRTAIIRQALAQNNCDLRVAIPGTVMSFNADEQTVTVRPAVQEVVRIASLPTDVNLPDLQDVPIVLPRAGGFALTLPVSPGDECLVIFGDMCIDAWWQSGALEGPERQLERRRHDLSDGFAVLGPWSQPRVLPQYSTESAQLRSDDGTVLIDVAEGKVTLMAPTIVAANDAAGAQALVQASFWTWFSTVLYPQLQAKGITAALPTPAPITSVLKGQ